MAREDAFIHRQNYHALKVQTARFQQAHYLHSAQRLSREGHDSRCRQAIHQIEQRAALYRLPALGKRPLELVEYIDIHHQESLLQGQFGLLVVLVIINGF